MLLLPLLLASTGDLMPWPMVERNQRLLDLVGNDLDINRLCCSINSRDKSPVCCVREVEVDNRNKQMTVHWRLGKQDYSLDEDAT